MNRILIPSQIFRIFALVLRTNGNMKIIRTLCFFFAGCLITVACRDYFPKPNGYFRFELPVNSYYSDDFKNCIFDLSKEATMTETATESFNIVYPKWNATIYCSLFPLKQSSLENLTEESLYFVERQAFQSVRTKQFDNPEAQVYALIFHIQGNTPSPTQFLLTDSIHSFLRGALYFEDNINRDSIAPVLDYINTDIQHFIENFRWKR